MAGRDLEMKEFQKRPLSDFKAGDDVEGTVTGVRPTGAFVDVGAMVDGYFPKENWKENDGKLEVGKTVKLRIEEVTGCRMRLA